MKKSILVVDDQKNIRLLLTHVLKDDFFVNTAVNGKDALKLINHVMFDMIVSDIAMPEFNGIQLIDYLKRFNKTKNIPVMFLSAKASSQERIEGFEHGAVEYVCKPFNPTEIKVRIKSLLKSINQQEAL